MQARLLRTDHSLRNSTLRFYSGFAAFSRQQRCSSSKPRPLTAKVQQRPDAGRPEWRQRTDQVVQRVTAWVNDAADQFDLAVMPRERGDARDRALMGLSLAVLVLLSMHLFRIYLHLYNASGLRTIRELMQR